MADGNRRQAQAQGTAEAIRRGSQAGAEIVGRTGKAAREAIQQGDAALEATARQAGDAMARAPEAAEAGAETMRRSGAEVARRAEAMEAGGRQLAQGTIRSTTEAAAAMGPTTTAAAGMAALPQAFAGFLGDMARTNWQIGQEMLRLTNPVALIELQQRMLRGYLDMILAGQAQLARTTREVEAAGPDAGKGG